MAFPKKDSELVPYATNFAAQLATLASAVSVGAAQVSGFAALVTAYVDAVEAMQAAKQSGTRSTSLTADRNLTRDNLLTAGRALYAYIQKNEAVSVSDKHLLGIHVINTNPSPVPAPTVSPTMAGLSVTGRRVKGRVHDNGSSRPSKLPGAACAWLYSYVGATYPTDPSLWLFQGAVTNGKFDVTFDDSVPGGAQVWLCAAWVSPRGEAGPVSVPMTTYLQGGGVSSVPGVKLAA